MDQRFKKINMDDLRNIIDRKGFYYLPLSRVYDEFKGCKYIIVTENPDFVQHNPQYAGEIIMTVRHLNRMPKYSIHFWQTRTENEKKSAAPDVRRR